MFVGGGGGGGGGGVRGCLMLSVFVWSWETGRVNGERSEILVSIPVVIVLFHSYSCVML